MNSWGELWLRARYQWYLFHWLGLGLVVLALLGLEYYLSVFRRYAIPDDAIPVAATIVAIDEPISRYFWNRGTYVVARSENGNIGRKSVFPPEIRGCAIGDRIAAFEKGLVVYLRPTPCE